MNNSAPMCAAILQRLARVIDPETGVDIVRMRLIEDLTVDEQGRVSYTFQPSSALCPIAVPLVAEICRAVREVPGVTSQAIRAEGYARGEELTVLLQELEDEQDVAAAHSTAAVSTDNVRRSWHS